MAEGNPVFLQNKNISNIHVDKMKCKIVTAHYVTLSKYVFLFLFYIYLSTYLPINLSTVAKERVWNISNQTK